ncbi:MAG TPA: glycosyltransferase family 9 protein [Longimicrobiaceae bacterium]|nr:glycosyltransferase family 9 protein [Longimicrobiaceae bacterium]
MDPIALPPQPAPRSPLRGGYLASNPLLVGGLRAVDVLLAALPGGRDGAPLARPPRRLLLAIGGHLGDAVIASAVLPLVAAVWPETEVGVLAGSWSRPVLQGHPLVRRIHTVDHWKLIRSGTGWRDRLRRYRDTRRRALAEIEEAGYDAAVDLHPYFPNSIPLLRRAGIPVRAGFTSGGFGPLLTHAAAWTDSGGHMADHHRALLARLDPRFGRVGTLRYALPPCPEGADGGLPRGGYVVVHMGAGLPLKEWPSEKWHALVGALLAEGHTLVFTGSGAEQREQAERTIGGRAGCRNLCDRLRWDEFVGAVAGARLVVSVDSVAGHLAAGSAVPAVVLFSGMNRIDQWRPLGDRVRTLTHPVPCAPCHLSRGCAEMACIRGLEVGEVLEAVRAELRAPLAGGAGGAAGPPGGAAAPVA